MWLPFFWAEQGGKTPKTHPHPRVIQLASNMRAATTAENPGFYIWLN
jgi:hypothetical protein